MLNKAKRLVTEWFAPYSTMYEDEDCTYVEVHYSWTMKEALAWAACSLRDEKVFIYKYHNLVAYRAPVIEA